jgi:hypothetical protein
MLPNAAGFIPIFGTRGLGAATLRTTLSGNRLLKLVVHPKSHDRRRATESLEEIIRSLVANTFVRHNAMAAVILMMIFYAF